MRFGEQEAVGEAGSGVVSDGEVEEGFVVPWEFEVETAHVAVVVIFGKTVGSETHTS